MLSGNWCIVIVDFDFDFKIAYGGHPAPTGRALPNLINAVKMFKVKVKTALAFAEINKLANAEINKLC